MSGADIVERLQAVADELHLPPSIQTMKNIRVIDTADEAAATITDLRAEVAALREALANCPARHSIHGCPNGGIEQ